MTEPRTEVGRRLLSDEMNDRADRTLLTRPPMQSHETAGLGPGSSATS